MDKAHFITQMKDQFVDADEIVLAETTPFREIGSFDSLTGMAIIVMIKDEMGVDISEKEFKSCQTADELYNLALSKK